MRQKEYSIINQISREIRREQRKKAFKYLPDTAGRYVRLTLDQLFLGIFAVLWTVFSVCEFYEGIVNKSDAMLGEAFHSFFHALGGSLSLFAICYSTESPEKDHRYPYGRRKLNVLAGFVNGLNGVFSAFFILVKQSHVFLDDEHHAEHDAADQAAPGIYERYSAWAKVVICLLMFLRFRRYFIYVTSRRAGYLDIKGL